MASRDQLFQRLDSALSTRLAEPGAEPPRLVRANSAFAKRQVVGDVVVEIDGKSDVVRSDAVLV